MRNLIIRTVDVLSSSYWFLPAAISLLAIMLALLVLQLDLRFGTTVVRSVEPVIKATPQGIRVVLTTIAGSMITVAGTVFSLTMVVLTLASQQYGPLIVSNFMRDRVNQFALGIFIATFIYCLVILPTINDEDLIIPVLSGLVAVILALFDAGLLIYFFHHVSQSVQPTYIIDNISQTLMTATNDVFPESFGHPRGFEPAGEGALTPPDFEAQARPLHSIQSGYLQIIDADQVLELTIKNDLILQFSLRPGAFIIKGSILGRLYPAERVTDAIIEQFQSAFSLGSERTLVQDSDLMVTQLVQIALRALSPGINDPYTAMLCIDRLGEALAKVARGGTPAAHRCDGQGNLRIITNPLDFRKLLHTSFDGICYYGASDATVMRYLLRTLELITQAQQDDTARDAIGEYAGIIRHTIREGITDPDSLEHTELQMQSLQRTLREFGA